MTDTIPGIAIIGLLVACGGPGAPVPVARPAPITATAPAAAACPFVELHASPPAVRVFASTKTALAALKSDSLGDPDDAIDLDDLAKEHVGAFGVAIKFKAYAGSTRGYHQFAVFVAGTRVVVVGRLADSANSIPPDCGMTPEDRVIDARLASSPRYPHLGVYRFRRADVADVPTLPDATMATGERRCPVRAKAFRIEDHFVDLDRGEEIMGIAEVYRAHFTRPEPAPTLPLAQLAFDGNGVVIPATVGAAACEHTFYWPWPDHE